MSAWFTTLLFEVVNFVALALALGWVFTKPMRKLLDEEAATHAKAQKDAADALEAAEHTRTELTAKLRGAEKEREEILIRARTDAEREGRALLDDAKTRIEEERRRAGQETEQRRQASVDELAVELGRVASSFVLGIFARAGAEVDAVLVRAATMDLTAMLGRGGDHLVVEAARPLNDEARLALRAAIGPAFDAARLRLVPELVAGVRVLCDAGLVDASARAVAAAAARSLAPGASGVR